MNTVLNRTEDVLTWGISGYHRYILSDPIHVAFASRHLCGMLGLAETDLADDCRDRYAVRVHPSDRQKYEDFLGALAAREQSLTEEYRLIKGDGSVLYVKDAAVSRRLADGTFVADSVLTDITDIKNENNDLQFLNETIPCGFLKYTCEKEPKVTYINQKMIDILRFPAARDGELNYLDLYKSNIFLMIPMEERRRFSKYLNRVYSAGAPLAGEMTLLRCDGTRAYVFGWVTKCVNEQGVEEFQSVCMDITERHRAKKATEMGRYLRALTDVYESIFEFDPNSGTVKCLHCGDSSSFKKFEDIAVQMDDALDKWMLHAVDAADRERLRAFFLDYGRKSLYEAGEKPPQITYRARSGTGTVQQYNGIFIKADDSSLLYCCRRVTDTEAAEVLRSENVQLKDLVMRFTDGLAAFEVSGDGLVKPLYASENVCEFFGYTREEWMPLMERSTPLETFVAYSEAKYEDFADLLANGEAEFTYFDYKTETERRIKAVCSQREHTDGPRYVMLYSVSDGDGSERTDLPRNRPVSIRTFGYFDVFVGDKPIAFRNKKAKELLALLVDRKGGYVTSEEAIGYLWEDEPTSTVTLSRYRKVALRLKNTLEEYGIADVVESVDGKRRIVPERVQCDLYEYLSGKEEYALLFKGSYLTNYSWGEITLGELMGSVK